MPELQSHTVVSAVQLTSAWHKITRNYHGTSWMTIHEPPVSLMVIKVLKTQEFNFLLKLVSNISNLISIIIHGYIKHL